jgi:hypothetical protein
MSLSVPWAFSETYVVFGTEPVLDERFALLATGDRSMWNPCILAGILVLICSRRVHQKRLSGANI